MIKLLSLVADADADAPAVGPADCFEIRNMKFMTFGSPLLISSLLSVPATRKNRSSVPLKNHVGHTVLVGLSISKLVGLCWCVSKGEGSLVI